MLRYFFCSVALMLLLPLHGDSARILALIPFPGRSHFISFAPLLEELANRGHQMTVVSAFPRKSPMKNYRDIVFEDYVNKLDRTEMNMFDMKDSSIVMMISMFRYMSIEFCDTFLSEPEVQNLIHSTEEQFDLIIYEPFFTECAYGIIHKFKAPFIHISSNSISKWMGDGVGNPYEYSYIPDMLLGFSHHMTFKERLVNTVVHTYFEFLRNYIILSRMEAVIRKHFNDPSMPSILEIEANSSFLLLNSHVSLNYPRPLTPNTQEVGGMHIKEPKKLPQNLQKILDEATDGVIYFSLGSNVKSVDMPETIRNTFLKCFSKLKQKVLWKWEADTLPGQPKNVYVSKWFPQSDILGHPNVKVFITHGGLLSTQEATYLGMPLIAIPFAADQNQNSQKAADQGYALVLDINKITEEELDWTLNEIIENNQYRERAKHLSNIFRDQPQNPLERAVFWTEYVIRHKGAHHMRSAALKLNFFQYYLLDVIAVIVLALSVLAVISLKVCKILIRRLFSKSSRTKQKEN